MKEMLKNKKRSITRLLVRSFSITSVRKGDPLSVTASAFSVPYAASLLSNPFGGAFIVLMGMGVALFCLTENLPEFFMQSQEYMAAIQRIDSILRLYETFLSYEQNGTAMLLANLDNFSPEVLANLYLSLQELITVRESAFVALNNIVDLPHVQFLGESIMNRIHDTLGDFRLSGNNLINLLRTIEDRLGIVEEERIPPFWFED